MHQQKKINEVRVAITLAEKDRDYGIYERKLQSPV